MEIKALKLPEDTAWDVWRRRIKSWFRLPKFMRLPDAPRSLPSELLGSKPGEYTWEDWTRDTKMKYPVRYFINETLPDFFRYNISKPIGNVFYWLRTHTYNRYHIINLKCPDRGLEYEWGWIDRSEAILIASFEILKDFIEKEYPHSFVDWQSDEYHSHADKEFHELYEWWMTGRKKSWDDYNKESKAFEGKGLKKDLAGNITPAYWEHLNKMEELEKQDQIMLKRLIEVRAFMWT